MFFEVISKRPPQSANGKQFSKKYGGRKNGRKKRRNGVSGK
jgi:hypothetical protein